MIELMDRDKDRDRYYVGIYIYLYFSFAKMWKIAIFCSFRRLDLYLWWVFLQIWYLVLSSCIHLPIYPFLSFVPSLALSRSFARYHNAHVRPADYNVVHFLIIIIPLFDMENPVGLKIDAFIRCSSSFIRNRFTNTKISWAIVRAE